MFLRVLAAMVAADAFDRHVREQQRQKWQAHQSRQDATRAPSVSLPSGRQHPHGPTPSGDRRLPERAC